MSSADIIERVKTNDLESVIQLLEADSSLINHRDEVGATPLHYAALLGHREILKLLLRHGADINARDSRYGATPAGWAIELFREAGGLLAIEIDDLQHAIQHGDVAWAKRLIQRFPKLTDANTADGVPLRVLAESGEEMAIKAIFNPSEE